jgi:hypothetical protein
LSHARQVEAAVLVEARVLRRQDGARQMRPERAQRDEARGRIGQVAELYQALQL